LGSLSVDNYGTYVRPTQRHLRAEDEIETRERTKVLLPVIISLGSIF